MIFIFTITDYSVEKLQDPFGILTGDRYEFYLGIEVEEDDELFTEKGSYIKIIFTVNEGEGKITQYHFYENETDQYIDMEMEEDEEKAVHAFCMEHLPE